MFLYTAAFLFLWAFEWKRINECWWWWWWSQFKVLAKPHLNNALQVIFTQRWELYISNWEAELDDETLSCILFLNLKSPIWLQFPEINFAFVDRLSCTDVPLKIMTDARALNGCRHIRVWICAHSVAHFALWQIFGTKPTSRKKLHLFSRQYWDRELISILKNSFCEVFSKKDSKENHQKVQYSLQESGRT